MLTHQILKMIKLFRVTVFLIFICLNAWLPTFAQQQPLRVFVIGNSFSGNAIKFLPDLAKDGGHELIFGKAQMPGASLKQHWDSVAIADQIPGRGKGYYGKNLRELLGKGSWDVVTIQQASIISSDSTTYSPYAANLLQLIKTLQPNAKVLMHQTWAYRKDAYVFGKISPTASAKSAEEMQSYIKGAYSKVSAYLHLPLIPVGDAFWAFSIDKKWGFQASSPADRSQYVYPALPPLPANSLHVGYRWMILIILNLFSTPITPATLGVTSLPWYGMPFYLMKTQLD